MLNSGLGTRRVNVSDVVGIFRSNDGAATGHASEVGASLAPVTIVLEVKCGTSEKNSDKELEDEIPQASSCWL